MDPINKHPQARRSLDEFIREAVIVPTEEEEATQHNQSIPIVQIFSDENSDYKNVRQCLIDNLGKQDIINISSTCKGIRERLTINDCAAEWDKLSTDAVAKRLHSIKDILNQLSREGVIDVTSLINIIPELEEDANIDLFKYIHSRNINLHNISKASVRRLSFFFEKECGLKLNRVVPLSDRKALTYSKLKTLFNKYKSDALYNGIIDAGIIVFLNKYMSTFAKHNSWSGWALSFYQNLDHKQLEAVNCLKMAFGLIKLKKELDLPDIYFSEHIAELWFQAVRTTPNTSQFSWAHKLFVQEVDTQKKILSSLTQPRVKAILSAEAFDHKAKAVKTLAKAAANMDEKIGNSSVYRDSLLSLLRTEGWN